MPETTPGSAVPWWRRRWVVSAVGAAVAIGVIVAAGPIIERYGGTAPGTGLPAVTLTRPTGAVPFDRVFTWRPVSGATSYQVAIFTPDGERSFEMRGLTRAGVKLADTVELPPGRYFVQITALRNAAVVAQSARTPFTVP